MAGTRYATDTKKASLLLIKRGLSYAQVKQELGVPKSTLSTWVHEDGKPVDRTRQLAHLEKARALAFAAIKKAKAARLVSAKEAAHRAAASLKLEQEAAGKSLLAMLYWAEGGKRDNVMKFTNTDPELVFLFISLLRMHFPIEESRFRIGLQIHYYHKQKQVIGFWSKKLRVPASQFWKVYYKPRSGKKKVYKRNFYGICNLHYSSSAIQRELIALGTEITNMISSAHSSHSSMDRA